MTPTGNNGIINEFHRSVCFVFLFVCFFFFAVFCMCTRIWSIEGQTRRELCFSFGCLSPKRYIHRCQVLELVKAVFWSFGCSQVTEGHGFTSLQMAVVPFWVNWFRFCPQSCDVRLPLPAIGRSCLSQHTHSYYKPNFLEFLEFSCGFCRGCVGKFWIGWIVLFGLAPHSCSSAIEH